MTPPHRPLRGARLTKPKTQTHLVSKWGALLLVFWLVSVRFAGRFQFSNALRACISQSLVVVSSTTPACLVFWPTTRRLHISQTRTRQRKRALLISCSIIITQILNIFSKQRNWAGNRSLPRATPTPNAGHCSASRVARVMSHTFLLPTLPPAPFESRPSACCF